jgi:ElaB/YqjD/DUF883 family membrane-anchored ribosome-binding protein
VVRPHHATVGLIYAIGAGAANGKIDELVKTKLESPYIEINKKSLGGALKQCADDLTDYIQSIVDAVPKIPDLLEKAKACADEGPDLPGKAKDALSKAGDLGAMDKMRAIKNAGVNAKNVAMVPGLCKSLKETVENAIKEVQGAIKEFNDSKSKIEDILKKCKDKKATTPKDCYVAAGNKINYTNEEKKQWEKERKPKKKGKK